jgi:diaminohydroxyphosphoribosylaminopyrimidine deaminase/5-amino-6-(5-phosphoribosylamino)uracil reductase
MKRDAYFMQKALKLAAQGRFTTSPNPAVGCVIVKNNRIVGRGYHEKPGGAHAEIVALEEAGGKARNGEMYVTLEPCCHYGRTPPCTKAIIEANIKRVIIAQLDPNPKVNGKGVRELTNAGIEVKHGVLEEEARKLNEPYNKWIRTGMPFVTMKAAITVDGKLSWGDLRGKKLSSPASNKKVHELRALHDAILVGANTVLKDNPRLTCRMKNGKVKQPVKVVLDDKLAISPKARLFNGEPKPIVFTAKHIRKPKKEATLIAAGAEIVKVECRNGRLALNEVLRVLGKRDVLSVLVEGGSHINSSFLDEKLVDRVVIILTPKIVGRGLDYAHALSKHIKLKLKHVSVLDNDVWLEYVPEH